VSANNRDLITVPRYSNMLFPNRSAGVMAVLVGLFGGLLGGCSGGTDGPERAVVSGEVTWQKKPIQDGIIRFISDSGPSAQAPIRDGSYKIDHKGGVPVGRCRVEVEGFEEKDIAESGSVIIEMPKKVGVQVIPQMFNSASTLQVDVTAGNANQHDFHLDVRR
jgi:hypothetical protein